MRFSGNASFSAAVKPRFADPGLAGEQHHLALAAFCPVHRRSSSSISSSRPTSGVRPRAQRLEPAERPVLRQHAPGALRLGEPLERLRAEIGKLEQFAPIKLSRALGDDDGVRLRQCLQPGGEIGRFADDRLLLRRARADQIADHHQPGRDSDPQLQLSRRLQFADGIHQRQAGSDRLLRVVLVRLRIAEIDEHAIAHVFGDEAVEAAYRLATQA